MINRREILASAAILASFALVKPAFAGLDMSMRGPLNANEQDVYDRWMAYWKGLVSRVPQCSFAPATVGQWRIERYEITQEDSWHLLRKDLREKRSDPFAWTPPGTYTRLTTDEPTKWGWPGGVIMHDQLVELRFIDQCLSDVSGHVLEVGLGLGLFVEACLKESGVKSLTVLEIDPDIAGYVGGTFNDKRLRIVNVDFRDWQPDEQFDRGWFDTIARDAKDGQAKFSRVVRDLRFYDQP